MSISRQVLLESAAELIMLSDKLLITISVQNAIFELEAIYPCISIAKKMPRGYYVLIEASPDVVQYFETGEEIDYSFEKFTLQEHENKSSKFVNWTSEPGTSTVIDLSPLPKYFIQNKILDNFHSPKINFDPKINPAISHCSININVSPLAGIIEIQSILNLNGWLTD